MEELVSSMLTISRRPWRLCANETIRWLALVAFCVGLGGTTVEIGQLDVCPSDRADEEGRVTFISVVENEPILDESAENDPLGDSGFSAPYASKQGKRSANEERMADHLYTTAARDVDSFILYPARHHVLDESEKELILQDISRELEIRCAALLRAGKTLEEARLRQRTENDLLMLRMVDTCKGVENYSPSRETTRWCTT